MAHKLLVLRATWGGKDPHDTLLKALYGECIEGHYSFMYINFPMFK